MLAVVLEHLLNFGGMLVVIRIMYRLLLEPMLGLEGEHSVDIVVQHNDPKLVYQLRINIFSIRLIKNKTNLFILLESHKRFGVLRDKLASSMKADEPISLDFIPTFFPSSSKYIYIFD